MIRTPLRNSSHRKQSQAVSGKPEVRSAIETRCVPVSFPITEGDANLALKVLDKIGVLEKAVPGSTDAAEIQRQQALARKKAAVAARKEHNKVDLDDALTI